MMNHPWKRPLLLTCAALLACAGGCGKGDGKGWTFGGFMGPSPKQQVAMAFDTEDPDKRREGIIGLSSHDWGLKEPYLKGYAAILSTDADPMVRAAAVRALGKAGDANYAADVAKALYDKSEAVRHDAAVALDNVIAPAALEPLCDRAVKDDNQDVRASCARALRHYPQEEAYQTLTTCLADPQFAVRHEAHASLVAMAGRDLGFEPPPWAATTLKQIVSSAPAGDKSPSWWDRLRGKKTPAAGPTTVPAAPTGG